MIEEIFGQEFNEEVVRLARLTEDKIQDLANFDCGDDEMNRFFHEEVLHEQEIGMNTTILLYYNEELAAACSICCDAITLNPEEKKIEEVPYAKVPAIKVARLGRDIKFKNLKLGKFLVDYIKSIAYDLNDSTVGVRFLTLDAYPKRVNYYREELGFIINEYTKRKDGLPVSMRADIFDR